MQGPTYFHPWLSDDGSSVLFLEPDAGAGFQRAFFEFTNGSGFRQLTSSKDVPEGVTAATLSGNGAIAYVGTPDGRILRISVPSGNIDELAGRTPQLTATENYAPGSVNWISGAALSGDSAQPRVMVGDLEAPLISAQPALVKFQIPWEIPAGRPVEIRLAYGSPPPFESVLTILTATIYANFLDPLTSPFGNSAFPPGLAYHQDFHSLVTTSNPAHERTGARYTTSRYRPKDTFLGLAPGYIGLYQMDLQVPEGLVNADSPLSCGFQDLQNGGYRIVATDLYVRVP